MVSSGAVTQPPPSSGSIGGAAAGKQADRVEGWTGRQTEVSTDRVERGTGRQTEWRGGEAAAGKLADRVEESSRTDPDDDVVDVTPPSALDVK